MKYSEAPNSLREEQVKYISTRWEDLASLERKWIDAVFQYLFITSSGAAIGTLTFMGATVQAKDPVMPWMVLMLVFYVVSLLFVGAGKVSQYFYIRKIYTNWREKCATYYSDSLDWEDMLNNDNEISKDSKLVKFFSWAAFLCFFGGIIIGFYQLSGGIYNGKPIDIENTKQEAKQPDISTGKPQEPSAIEVRASSSDTKQAYRGSTGNTTAEAKKITEQPTPLPGENK